MFVLTVFILFTLNISNAEGRKVTSLPADEWYECSEKHECMLAEEQCLRIISINKKFEPSLEAYKRSVDKGCGGNLGDAQAMDVYQVTCEKKKCGYKFAFDKPEKFYAEWKNKVEAYLKLVGEYENAEPVGLQFDEMKRYYSNSFSPYLDIFESYQELAPSDDALLDLYKSISEGAGVHYEKLSEVAGNVYLKSPDRFKRVFKKAKLKDVELFCKRTRVGLEAKKIMPGDIRRKVLGEICKEQKS